MATWPVEKEFAEPVWRIPDHERLAFMQLILWQIFAKYKRTRIAQRHLADFASELLIAPKLKTKAAIIAKSIFSLIWGIISSSGLFRSSIVSIDRPENTDMWL